MSSSFTRLASALAVTAALANAQKFNFGAFMSLESQEVDNLAGLPHTESEANYEGVYEDDENQLEWDVIEKVDGGLKCKEGFTKVGCCKCVHDDQKAATAASHLVPDVKAIPLTYHGMDPTAKPAAAAPTAHTAEPNLAGWFSKSSSETTESSKTTTSKDEDKSTDQKTSEDDH